MIVVGDTNNDNEISPAEQASYAQWYNYILLCLMPLAIGFGNISMGELRSMNKIIISFYSSIGIFIVAVIGCLCSEKGFMPSEEEIEEEGLAKWWVIALLCNGFAFLGSW